MPRAKGLVIAAPASGHGKTILTAALLRHLTARGVAVRAFKSGPDYIDPGFHAAASRAACINLDGWAMRAATLDRLVHALTDGAEYVIGEGAMGLFDGASDGAGSSADLAARYGWPVVLVIDVRGQGASVAALAEGFARHRPEVTIAGVILNRVASENHARILRSALAATGIRVMGAVPRSAVLEHPSRHLGLVQASEADATAREEALDAAAALIGEHVDVATLLEHAAPARLPAIEPDAPRQTLPPLGNRIAIARDDAFRFCYETVLADWRAQGAALSFFSPLADEAPDPAADAIYLPGGYPELHAPRLAANAGFRAGMHDAAERRTLIYGECGGYMVLGRSLTDAEGAAHPMLGLLPLETSFAEGALTLGYRMATTTRDSPLGAARTRYRGHEFHYCRTVSAPDDSPLFACDDGAGEPRGTTGVALGTIMGSFIHLIDRTD